MPSPNDNPIRPWTFAGIMLSYWCNARCEFCYVSCGPDASHWAEPRDAVRWWRELADLARGHGKRLKVHLTGGEPFGNWPVLLETARLAHAEGLTAGGAFQKVETNAFWADGEDIVRERVGQLDRLGMRKLAISADPFHQRFIPPERVRTCVETARKVLGEDRVQVRWLDWYEQMRDTRDLNRQQWAAIVRDALARHPERLVGRAGRRVAPLLEGEPAEAFAGQTCQRGILGAKHVHIDPCGNVFPGTCAGVILGNAQYRPISAIWSDVTERYAGNPVLAALIAGGPHALSRCAEAGGFQLHPAGYATKCHLCSHVRRFRFERGEFPATIGPGQCYPPDDLPADPDDP